MCSRCGEPGIDHCWGCAACPGQECPDWCETNGEPMHDRIERRIGLDVGESREVEFGGRRWIMKRTQ